VMLSSGATMTAALALTRAQRHLQGFRLRSRRVAVISVEGSGSIHTLDVVRVGSESHRAVLPKFGLPPDERTTRVVDAQPKHLTELANRAEELKRQILQLEKDGERSRAENQEALRELWATHHAWRVPQQPGTEADAQLMDVAQNEDAVAALDGLVQSFNHVFQELGPPPTAPKDPKSIDAGDGGPRP
jgi:hypothetical protein